MAPIVVTVGFFLKKQYSFVDANAKNNGNVQAITDVINSGRTQSFGYDALNRLTSAQSAATSGTDCWGQSYGYDIWANMTSQAVTKCSAPTLSLSVNTNNRITNSGFTYDAAGNLTADGSFTYQWDGESRLKSLNTTGATYTYDPNGMRVRKQSTTETTEYIYFGGQPIAERDATNGDWSDYIYAGGRRIAKADSYEYRLWLRGDNAPAGALAKFHFPSNPQVNGYIIRSGDRIYLRQENIGIRGGMVVKFTDGSDTRWNTLDQRGYPLNDDQYGSGWHMRYADLSAHQNKTIEDVYLVNDVNNPGGYWNAAFTDIALVSTDGAVRPIYNRQKTMAMVWNCDPAIPVCKCVISHPMGAGWAPFATTVYYHGDHLGSSRLMSSYDATPIWEATYLPYGQEHAPGGSLALTTNHYKFTGKERDGESGLDYFGARYYASAQGRFLSPDWSATPTPVPYADLTNPQSLNLYSYVRNNPLNATDADGHCCEAEWNYFKREIRGLWDTTGGAAVHAVKELASGQAATNVRETYFGGNAAGKVIEAGKEFGSQTVDMAVSAAQGDPEAIGRIAGLVISTKITSELNAKVQAAKTVDVVHYTNEAGAQAITEAGQLNAGTYVTTPNQIPAGSTAAQIEGILEVAPSKGTNSFTVQTPKSNLATPPNGTTTSGGAAQYQLKQPVKVDTTAVPKKS